MQAISHTVPLIRQDLQDCVQAGAAQILQYYGVDKSLEEIKKEVPVYISEDGKPLGSSLGHIATYFVKLGLETIMHVTDTQIFDRSWNKLSKKKLIEKLLLRQKYIKHPVYKDNEFKVIFDGYISFLKTRGKITFPIVTNEYIYNLLETGPIYAVVNFQFLNSVPKSIFVKNKSKFIKDDIKGNTSTHVIVISGYKDGKFTIVDSDKKYGGIRQIGTDHLLGAFYLAQTDYDNLLITLSQ